MKDKKNIEGKRVTINNEPCNYLEDELPAEMDFSKLKSIENPTSGKNILSVVLEPDLV